MSKLGEVAAGLSHVSEIGARPMFEILTRYKTVNTDFQLPPLLLKEQLPCESRGIPQQDKSEPFVPGTSITLR